MGIEPTHNRPTSGVVAASACVGPTAVAFDRSVIALKIAAEDRLVEPNFACIGVERAAPAVSALHGESVDELEPPRFPYPFLR